MEVSWYWRHQKKRLEAAKIEAKQTAVQSSKEIGEKLQKLQDTANGIASDLTSGSLTKEQLLDRLKKDLEKNPDFLEIGAAYTPFSYEQKTRLYAPFYTRKNKIVQQRKIEEDYDYTTPDTDWYHQTLERGSFLPEPYFDESSKEIIVDYDTAFYESNRETKAKKPIGVIYANLSQDKLNESVREIKLGKSGYTFILSQKGVFISHPSLTYVKEQKTIFALAQASKNHKLKEIGDKAIKNQSAEIDFFDPVTQQEALVILEPIPLRGWTMGVVILKDDSETSDKTRRQTLIRITIESIVFLFFLSVLILRADRGNMKRLGAVSCLISLFYVSGIGFIWYLALAEKIYNNNRNLLLSESNVNNYLKDRFSLAKKANRKPPLLIPTGLFVQQIKFNSANDVFISGYIWQKYTDGVHDGVSREFIFPEGNEITLEEMYKYKDKGSEVIGWYFEATFRESFDFSHYPFDFNDVWLRLWPKDFHRQDLDREVILVPDFSAYDLIYPLAKPGLEKDFVLEGWLLQSSFFEYKFNDYNTNFGIPNTVSQKDYPELYFTVILKRAFLGILIARIVPLSVVAFLLFLMMLLGKENATEIIVACGGFIFIVILDQISVRQAIAWKGILYFEYFYFIIYLFILIVALNALLWKLNKNIPVINYQNNRIPKLLYWPSLLGTLLLITIFTFY
ncbi:cache domain-containing protein [Limnofasciculus baicalensis]|uniref:Cache domain-containing protein n=1 Tax=Limnofasciculus baicalensis BBK-W-15 TaxID=2699891 RepID=A0AAE3KTG4_9CYAN|nr:cache domain-containing protein [Limnofasciculus baicalensis]MCP2730502.1 cache domain-containing protein [Limnofasciculus baicalensis BBK-W-15]